MTDSVSVRQILHQDPVHRHADGQDHQQPGVVRYETTSRLWGFYGIE